MSWVSTGNLGNVNKLVGRTLVFAAACLLSIFSAIASSTAQRIRFEDVAEAMGLRIQNISGSAEKKYIVDSTGSGACFFDYDGDGFIDLYVVNGATFEQEAGPEGPHDVLYRNRDGASFEDVTEKAGIRDRGWGGGCAAGDFDNDGDPDLYITNFGENAFYVNRGDGTFVERTSEAGFSDSRPSSSAAFGDLDGDGFLDLVVGTYIQFELGVTPGIGSGDCIYRGVETFCGPDGVPGDSNQLFRNRRDGTFENRTREAGIYSTEAKTLGLILSDLDGDGRLDIYAACDSTINLFFRNVGDFTFEDESLLSGAGYSGRGFEQSGMGVSAGDPDGDGDIDLFVTNFQNDHNTLYLNLGGGEYEEVTDRVGLSAASIDYLSWGTHFVDLDNDGDEDLFVASGHVYPQAESVGEPYAQRNQMFENRGDGKWVELEKLGPGLEVTKTSRGTAVGDFDNDGWLDIFVNEIDDTPSLLHHEGSGETKALKLSLVGVNANRDGVGARIELQAGGRTQHRELRFSDGYLGSNDARLHFGLGEASQAQSVQIVWPGGSSEKVGPLPEGFLYVVKQGQGVVARLPFGG
jgi:hypothetical protein